ncbi:MAG: rhamnulokinase family protein [Alistipes sp.]
MATKHFIAFDLGATSGRTILGSLSGNELRMKELTRFPNQILPLGEHVHWNIFSLYEHLCDGLRAAAAERVEISSIGIDTWGVDIAFVGRDGEVLGLPYAYRDPQTEAAPEGYFKEVMPRQEVYKRTGIQIMDFNTIYQLYALRRNGSSQLEAADKLLFMPDALSYLLTGQMVTEYTIASTSQLLNPRTKLIEGALLEGMGIAADKFCPVVMPGHQIGLLKEQVATATGLGRIPVVAVAGHDTASAVAAVPACDEHFAYLSSGTWSLMGIETQQPIITEQTFDYNITNEGGVEGTTRLLKNITGMWLLEECLKAWKQAGTEYSYPEIVRLADEAQPFRSMIDPDHASFAHPQSMTAAIAAYCERTGQPVPRTHAEVIRTIFESLALKYRTVLNRFRELAPFSIERLHVIGGGSKNALLNQFTANSIGIPVIAGPSEATAIGNIMLQAKAAGLSESLTEMRQLIARCVPTETFTPDDTPLWQEASIRFDQILDTASK